MPSNSKSLEELNKISEQIKICRKCKLCKTAINAVPGDGNPESKIIFIGEAPGFHEDQQGKPFVGRAGKLLEFMLSQIAMKREDVWIGNIIKHRPPDNRDPLPEEIDACKDYLTQQICIINPKIIVTLGRFSMNYFLSEAKISVLHGKPTVSNNKVIYPLYHPAAALRNGQVKIELIKDFLKIPDLLKMDIEDFLKDNSKVKNENESEPEQFTFL
jgi:uracil-DNA glycosylase